MSLHLTKQRSQQPALSAFSAVMKRLRGRYARRTSTSAATHPALVLRVKEKRPYLSLDPSTLWRWEEGQVGRINATALEALAEIYDVEFVRLLSVLNANKANRELQPEDAWRLLKGGDDDDPTEKTAANREQWRREPDQEIMGTAVLLIELADKLSGAADFLLRHETEKTHPTTEHRRLARVSSARGRAHRSKRSKARG